MKPKTQKLTSITRDDLSQFIYSQTKEMDLNTFISCFTNPIEEIIQYSALLVGAKSCQRTSLLFNPHRLTTTTKINNSQRRSIFTAIHEENFCRNLARVFLWKGLTTKHLFYSSIGIGINGVCFAYEFAPYIARDLSIEYGVNINSKVLDPCSGWGGRMLGISCVSDDYTGFEPCQKTYEGLQKLGVFITSHPKRKSFKFNINNIPYEDAILQSQSYDFAITSPPYYDTEEYSTEENNSFNKYKTFGDWIDGFYYPMIDKTMDALKDTSTFILNIGSRRYPLNQLLIDKYSKIYSIERLKDKMSQGKGLGRKGGGESFYSIRKI